MIAASGSGPGLWDDPHSNDYYYPYPSDEVAEWADKPFPCHRSSLAGPALAAQQIQSTVPGVTFVHYACSGAKINAGDTPKADVQDVGASTSGGQGAPPPH